LKKELDEAGSKAEVSQEGAQALPPLIWHNTKLNGG
jgi:hypothetical protein